MPLSDSVSRAMPLGNRLAVATTFSRVGRSGAGVCAAFLALGENPAGGGGGTRSVLKERGPGPKAQGPALLFGRPWGGPQGRPPAAKRRRPPDRWDFPPSNRSIHHPFQPRLSSNQTSPPLPMSGGPAHSAGKPKKFTSWFSPAFSKAGQGFGGGAPNGVQGQSPWRGPRAKPRRGPHK